MSDKKIMVVTDSSASLPPEMADKLGIRIIPLWLIWDEQSFLDGVDIDPHTFYQRLKDSKTLPSSTQPTAMEFKALFETLAGECAGIVCVLASSKISGTVDSACAAREFSPVPVEVVDSGFSAMGQGLIAISAARAAAAGASLAEVAAAAEKIRDAVHLLFVVDTLEYLHKGGRIGKAQALMGTLLRIKPLIGTGNGEVQPKGKARTQKKALTRLFEMTQEFGEIEDLTIAHSTIPEEAAAFTERLSPVFEKDKIYQSRIGPVIGTYLGPGSIAIGIIEKSSQSS